MDTSLYFFAGYTLFWLLPALYIFRLTKRLKAIETKLDAALKTV